MKDLDRERKKINNSYNATQLIVQELLAVALSTLDPVFDDVEARRLVAVALVVPGEDIRGDAYF